jgi:hypothetical protein
MHPWMIYALEIARDREREARKHELATLAKAGATPHPSRLRRPAAVAFAAFSRGSAVLVRRLDDCVADDLGRALAPTE